MKTNIRFPLSMPKARGVSAVLAVTSALLTHQPASAELVAIYDANHDHARALAAEFGEAAPPRRLDAGSAAEVLPGGGDPERDSGSTDYADDDREGDQHQQHQPSTIPLVEIASRIVSNKIGELLCLIFFKNQVVKLCFQLVDF